jgi:hypothetical protein
MSLVQFRLLAPMDEEKSMQNIGEGLVALFVIAAFCVPFVVMFTLLAIVAAFVTVPLWLMAGLPTAVGACCAGLVAWSD